MVKIIIATAKQNLPFWLHLFGSNHQKAPQRIYGYALSLFEQFDLKNILPKIEQVLFCGGYVMR